VVFFIIISRISNDNKNYTITQQNPIDFHILCWYYIAIESYERMNFMLSLDIMKQIKQSNVSKNADKTMARIKEAFASAPKDVKSAIITQTTQNRNTIYRVIHTGNASGRIVLAFADVLGISPYYFTGAIDEKAPLTDKIIKKFLSEHGYKKLIAQGAGRKRHVPSGSAAAAKATAKAAAKASKTTKATKPAKQPEHAAPAAGGIPSPITAEAHPTVFRVSINESEQMRAMVDQLDLASATQLLEGLYIRAKAGGNAEQLCEIVKYCLLA
jgi:hypothetical protein